MLKEHLLQAAGRYIQDAHVLFNSERYENAAYLSAYSVECILKLLISHYTETQKAKSYNHSLFQLNEATTSKFPIISPQINNVSTLTTEQLHLLSTGHPERRYWANNYISSVDA